MEVGQLHDDIQHHLNSQIDDIFNEVDRSENSDSVCSSVNVFNEAGEWWVEPPESDDDDLPVHGTTSVNGTTYDTDTEDGAEEHIDLIQANIKLIAFLKRQSITIARLRQRILGLRSRITELTSRLDNTTNRMDNVPLDDTSTDHASVLFTDAHADTTFLVAPLSDPVVQMDHLYHPKIKQELKVQLARINENKNSKEELWMYFDSGASRSVISTTSPIRHHLQAIGPAYGSCSIGDGTPLNYLEKGSVRDNLEITVVDKLKYDLFSSVNAAKRGLTSIIDFDMDTGKNNSFIIDKFSGNITPLVERGKGILELPLHLMLPAKAYVSIAPDKEATHDALPPNVVSMFWHCYDDVGFDPNTRDNNKTDYSLFTFDIIKSLNPRERDFLIHARLGHLPRPKILQMIKNGTTGISDYSGKFKELCKPCFQAKQRAENHGKEHQRHPNGRPGEHLHSDLAVLSTLDINGNKYVLTVVDEVTHEVVVALLKKKTAGDVHAVCKKIQLLIAARTGNKLVTWQFDRGTEFLNSTFEKWLKLELGVVQRFSNIEHPWENGLAERSFQTLFALSRSLLKHADLPDRIWGKAILHSAYLMNRSPSTALGGIAPLQFRTKEPTDLSHLRVFGSPAQIFVRPTIRDDNKLSDRSISGTFVGISDKGNGYVFLIRKLDMLVDIDTKDAKFNETFSDYRARQGKLTTAPFIEADLREEHDINTKANSSKNDTDDTQHAMNESQPRRQIAPRQFLIPGTHQHKEMEVRRQQYSNLCLENLVDNDDAAMFLLNCMEAPIDEEMKLIKELELLTACATFDGSDVLLPFVANDDGVDLSIPDPKSQSDIDKMKPKDAKRFNDATITEVNGMKGKQVFINATLDELPPGTKVYQSVVNWTSKTNLGVYVKTKCRICFGGHTYDKSYSDTFAPTVNFCTVLVIICLSAMFGWFMGSIDYSQAYLNANIDEICVMRAPISVREYSPQRKEYYWLLKKAIYGHPKASRLWAECLHKKLLELGYTQFLTDQCVYGKWTNWDANEIQDNEIPQDSSFVFLLIHSDDIIVVSHDPEKMNSAKSELLNAFEGTDNGILTSFCGVEIKSDEGKVSLSMEYYWDKLMRKFNVKPDETENSPLKTKIKRSECPKEPDEQLKTSYLQIIGSIIYGYTHCRLDLAFPVNMLTRIMHSPAEQHYNLLRKLLHYINGTKNWTLNYFRDHTVVYGMDFVFFCNVDAAHADDEETHRSTGGWFFFLRKGQGAVAAKSGQTKDIPLSSTESETIWGSSAAMQGAFLKQFLDETRLFKSTSFELHEDSQPMINAQKRNVSQSRFKHMKTKHHYIRKLIFDGWCKLIKIPSKMNTADMATKILPASTISVFSRVVLGLHDTLHNGTDSD
jgi:transposase InsO family protein